MEVVDQYYIVNGKVLSVFREIEKVVEKSRIEVMVSAGALENIMSSNTRSSNFYFENAILENGSIYISRELLKTNQNFNSSIEAKKISIMKYLQLRGKIDSSVKILNNSIYYVNTKCKPGHLNSFSPADHKGSINYQNAEYSDNEFPCPLVGAEENGFMYGKNFWFKIFYYFQSKYRFPLERHVYIKKILSEYPNVLERLKHFGYNLLLRENEIVDTYGFKLLQQMYESQKIQFEKAKLQSYMAMEFVSSNFAENIIKACNENSCHFPKPRMNYTNQFKYV